jgi:hypothetical protein
MNAGRQISSRGVASRNHQHNNIVVLMGKSRGPRARQAENGLFPIYVSISLFQPIVNMIGHKDLRAVSGNQPMRGAVRLPKLTRSALSTTRDAYLSAVGRAKRKRQLAPPKRGFYIILRPEDRSLGTQPERWIAPYDAPAPRLPHIAAMRKGGLQSALSSSLPSGILLSCALRAAPSVV